MPIKARINIISRDQSRGRKSIQVEEYQRIIKTVYSCVPGEWEQEYDNPYVLDGTQWELNIAFEQGYRRADGRSKIEVYGSNAYPPLWDKLLRKLATFWDITPSML